MNRALLLLTAALFAALPGCAAPGEETSPVAASKVAAAVAPALWNFADSADAIRGASCDQGGAPMSGLLPLNLSVEALNTKQAENLTGRLPPGAQLHGAWELTSTDPNFGGLSGLAIEDDSTLLAVSDAGGWVKLGLASGAPSAAVIGYMRGADGKFLSGKRENDAEDLAFRDGIAFVSFERDFRIEAFDIGTCGASAKAVKIAALPKAFDGKDIDENEGPEAVALTPGGALRFAYEGATGSVSPIGRVLATGAGEWTGAKSANPAGFALVSTDIARLPDGTDRTVSLYRAFDPIRGARSVLVWGEGANQKLTLSRPLLTDNFEGMAVQPTGPATARIWIVSDNNFTKLQRNLIYAFDVTFE